MFSFLDVQVSPVAISRERKLHQDADPSSLGAAPPIFSFDYFTYRGKPEHRPIPSRTDERLDVATNLVSESFISLSKSIQPPPY